MNVKIHAAASREFLKLRGSEAQRAASLLERLASSSSPMDANRIANAVRIHGDADSVYEARFGNLRILYTFTQERGVPTLLVLTASHAGEASSTALQDAQRRKF